MYFSPVMNKEIFNIVNNFKNTTSVDSDNISVSLVKNSLAK